jgi:hypothetical protein
VLGDKREEEHPMTVTEQGRAQLLLAILVGCLGVLFSFICVFVISFKLQAPKSFLLPPPDLNLVTKAEKVFPAKKIV